ncbi:hypothetical protein D5S17_13405 [Pseudonocardiaceae bacterium YIM PH 21723]|nr:hypothetical protein D5S17_13405 [Pseudonocardiaceae bacterium YIM PH 21723]
MSEKSTLDSLLALPFQVAKGSAENFTAIMDAVRAVPKLADSLSELAKLRESVQQTLEQVNAELPGVIEKLEALRLSLETAEPGINGVAGSIEHLDESIQVLANAIGPLQGTTERLGRLVNRLPNRNAKPPQIR